MGKTKITIIQKNTSYKFKWVLLTWNQVIEKLFYLRSSWQDLRAEEIASSKSSRGECKLEVFKTQQEAQGVWDRRRGWRSRQGPGQATQSVVHGPAASASPGSVWKITPNLHFSSFTVIGPSDFRWHASASYEDHLSKSPLQVVVAMWHKGSNICDFSEVSPKGHPFLPPAVWNISLKATSPAAVWYHERSLRMEATQSQTINRGACVPEPLEGLASPGLPTSQFPEHKTKDFH